MTDHCSCRSPRLSDSCLPFSSCPRPANSGPNFIFQRKPLYHFITTVLAIIGGTFTVAGMIDSMVSGDKQYKIFIVNVMNFEGYNDS